MLNPIKSFFNYLQKNANSPSSKSSDELSMTEEVNPSAEGVEGENFEDPLTDPLADPLAIDEEFTASKNDEDEAEGAEAPSELENSTAIDEIIFVDIEKLKCKEKKSVKKVNQSDINGNNRHSPKAQNKKEQENPSKEVSQPPQTENENKQVESSSCADDLNKSADSSIVISVNSSEPETDDVTDTSVLLEEIRSDGSDSGLGSDSLRSISAIENNLKSLTPSKSSLKRRSIDNLHEDQAKKPKRTINFGDVTVFYFPRCQGFGCVPTQGGSTLGMTAKHAYKKSFTLVEHAIEQRRLYRLKMAGNEMNPSSSSSDESKSDDEISENSLSEADSEAYGFLQPVTARQRRALLKSAGVRKIDTSEKDECRQLRTSREVCGCTCRGYCDPDTCECSQAGIKCQVDRLKPHEFPCGCTRDGCGNVNGRIEFNPARVKTHFIHTIMRLELEKRQGMSETDSTVTTSVIQNSSKWWRPPQQQAQQQQQQSQPQAGCSYSNYTYSATQYPTKIPPISTMVAPSGQESLDLHYAYRDEYNMTDGQGSTAFASTDYYSTYSYNPYQTNYHQIPYQQPSFSAPDCQYSNYTPTNGSGRFHHRVDSAVESYPNNYHNGQPSRINYQSTSQEVVLSPAEGYCTIASDPPSNSLPNGSNGPETTTTVTSESNENLSEIIKKSIVETVTA